MTKYLSLMLPNVPVIDVAADDASELLLGEIGVTVCVVRPDVVAEMEAHPAVALPISSSNTMFDVVAFSISVSLMLRLVTISGVRVEFMFDQWRGEAKTLPSVRLSCSNLIIIRRMTVLGVGEKKKKWALMFLNVLIPLYGTLTCVPVARPIEFFQFKVRHYFMLASS